MDRNASFKKALGSISAMVRRKGGLKRKSRRLMTKPLRKRGKVSLTRFLATYAVGDKVTFVQEPSVQKGQFHVRFHGRAGVITEKRGACYAVTFKEGSKSKTILTHPVHLKRLA